MLVLQIPALKKAERWGTMFEQTVTTALVKLGAARQRGLLQGFAIIGGLAVSRWGEARATADVDLVIAITDNEHKVLADYLQATYRRGDSTDPLIATFTFAVPDELGEIPIQLVVVPPRWTEKIFLSLQHDTINGCSFPFVSWQSLVLLKLYAGGVRDLEDVKSVLGTQRPTAAELAQLRGAAQALRVSKKLEKLLASFLGCRQA